MMNVIGEQEIEYLPGRSLKVSPYINKLENHKIIAYRIHDGDQDTQYLSDQNCEHASVYRVLLNNGTVTMFSSQEQNYNYLNG